MGAYSWASFYHAYVRTFLCARHACVCSNVVKCYVSVVRGEEGDVES